MAKILVIEDSEDTLEMISVVLKNYGHEVIVTSDITNLSSVICSFKTELVLLDVWLGHQSGRDICKQIKKANAHLPVILMSADAKLLADYETCQANDFIEKPFEIMDLKNKIDNLLNKYLHDN